MNNSKGSSEACLHHTLGPHQKAQKNIKLISKGGKGMKLKEDNNWVHDHKHKKWGRKLIIDNGKRK